MEPTGRAAEDRRSRDREVVDLPCQVVTESDFFLLGDRIVDLGDRGLLLYSDGTAARVGERVVVSFRPPASAQWIDVGATVVRLVNGQTPGAPGIGLELDELPPFEGGLLSASLDRVPRPSEELARASAPRRHLRRDAVRARRVIAVGE